MRDFVLIILGGVGGAIVSWIGNLINDLISHRKEIQRLTYLRKLEVCENAMGVIGMMRDKLAPIILWGQQDLIPQNLQEVDSRCNDLSHYLTTTLTDIYKLYLYFDIRKIDEKYKLWELVPTFVGACAEIKQLNVDVQNKSLSEAEWNEVELKLREFVTAIINLLKLIDKYLAEIAELLQKEVVGHIKR